ncbi:hypothetical protein [Rhodanobacter thiooxydans]|jgi:hypothetical protein|uniref:hypothetical protein n=1 Tax=Rhodanobacter thiooxydans TaxID=416169 RepID=UPI00131F27F8|nr:hypothetical protein [Rhodanobacter thiooxydans]
MTRPKSSTGPTRERRAGKVLRTVWRRLYRFSERLDACGECAVVVFIVALSLMFALGLFK